MVTDTEAAYTLIAGKTRVLPAYMERQSLLLGAPRAEPLACVMPAAQTSLKVMGMDGKPIGMFDLTNDYVHVMSQVGYHFPVALDDIERTGSPSRFLPFRLGAPVVMTAERPIASALYGFWAITQHEPGLKVYEFWRRDPAFVYGRVPADASDDEWIETETGCWRLVPDSYLIGELNGMCARVVPRTYMVREFASLVQVCGPTVEVFDLPNFG